MMQMLYTQTQKNAVERRHQGTKDREKNYTNDKCYSESSYSEIYRLYCVSELSRFFLLNLKPASICILIPQALKPLEALESQAKK
jgi:hypothetical protein